MRSIVVCAFLFSGIAITAHAKITDRFTVIDVPINGKILGSYPGRHLDWYAQSDIKQMQLVEGDDHVLYAAWHDADKTIHIGKIKADYSGIEAQASFAGQFLRDFIVEEGNLIAVYLNGNSMRLRKQKIGGDKVFDIGMISRSSSSLHKARVVRNGGNYAVYFGIHNGGHEGDALQFFNPQGQLVRTAWDWGCSHMINNRLLTIGDKLLPICASDYYTAGINAWYQGSNGAWGRKNVVPDVMHYNGFGSVVLSGAVAIGDYVYVAMDSGYQRSNRDAALIAFETRPPHPATPRKWLTNTSGDEYGVKIAKIDQQNLLITMYTGAEHKFHAQIFTPLVEKNTLTLEPVTEQEILPAQIDQLQDPITLSDGRVVWAGYWTDAGILRLQVIQ